jgi:hypothetical protein
MFEKYEFQIRMGYLIAIYFSNRLDQELDLNDLFLIYR